MTDYAAGTSITVGNLPFGEIVAATALCPDGKVRRCKRVAAHGDTFFSVPAAVTVKGRTVSGYIEVETVSGSSIPTDDDPAVVKFRPYLYGRNADVFAVAAT